MITASKLNEYENYHGNYDGFYLQKVKTGTNITNNDEWYLIKDLIQDLILVQKGLSTQDFAEKVNKKILENCDSIETIKKMKLLAKISQTW